MTLELLYTCDVCKKEARVPYGKQPSGWLVMQMLGDSKTPVVATYCGGECGIETLFSMVKPATGDAPAKKQGDAS